MVSNKEENRELIPLVEILQRRDKSILELRTNLRKKIWIPVQPEVLDFIVRPPIAYKNVKFPASYLFKFLGNPFGYSSYPPIELAWGEYETLEGESIQLELPYKLDLAETLVFLRPTNETKKTAIGRKAEVLNADTWDLFPLKNPSLSFDLEQALKRLHSVRLGKKTFSLEKKNKDVIALACFIWRRNEGFDEISVDSVNDLTEYRHDRLRDYLQSNHVMSPLWQTIIIPTKTKGFYKLNPRLTFP